MNKERKNILDNEDFKKNPFEIPEDYFETNSIKLIENILSQKKSAFEVPEDYFETNKIHLLENITNSKPAFEIPDEYFETSKNEIIQKISPTKNRRTIVFLKYTTIAASIAGIIWGIYIFQNNTKTDISDKPCQTIACLTKQDVLSKESLLDEEILEQSVSDEIIEQHFNSNSIQPSDTNSNELNETF
ncbi:MAG TPA: hypothetical protein PK995_01890 [Bacteroidia bacterium]|nr:hypothetical protein [Bacteroidia bacterium]